MKVWHADASLASQLFDDLRMRTSDAFGISRDSYGAGEQEAYAIFRDTALRLGLEVETDFAGNFYATLPGQDRSLPRVLFGSHMDSVPAGGNFDGATGVVAGLAILSTLKQAGLSLRRDIGVMGIRAEETPWFPYSFIGSRAALGTLDPAVVDTIRRLDTNRTVADHMADLGYDPDAVRQGRCWLTPQNTAAFIEIHIEQGPKLVEEGLPIAIVTGISGSTRWRQGRVMGVYAHSGGTPRQYRHDAVAGFIDLAHAVNEKWRALDAQGEELVVTFCTVNTDRDRASMNRVAGQVDFSLDIRSVSASVLSEMTDLVPQKAEQARDRYRVEFDLGPHTFTTPCLCDVSIRDGLAASAREQGIACCQMPSGGGHDSQAFIEAGIPAAMIFVRNENGSHNPNEHMDLADLEKAMNTALGYIIHQYAE